MSEKIWCLRPRYLNEFKCDGSKCGALCCRSDWCIYVDATTYDKYSALQGVTQNLRAEEDDKYSIIFNTDGNCPFLEDNLCRLQKVYGEEYLSRVCASYPRITTSFGDFMEMALSPTCPLAAELILLAKKPLELEIVAAEEKILRLGANNILHGVPNDLAPLIFDVQLIMISILQERRLTLDQRLIVLGFFLDRVEELLYTGGLNVAMLENLSAIYSSERFMIQQVPLMLASIRFNAAAHERLMLKITAELFGEPLIVHEKSFSTEFAPLLENLLVNEIILNVFPWRVDASITKNFSVLATLYKVFERLLVTKGVQSVEGFLSVASDFSHEVDHSDDFITKISAQVEDDMLRFMGKLLRV